MKEKASISRDTVVLMVMSFGFGVLLSWGLFYKWGSAPSIKAVDVSAWIQAIGSIAAICVAATIPIVLWRRDERSKRAQQRYKTKAHLLNLMPFIKDLRYATRRSCFRIRESNSHLFLRDIVESLQAKDWWPQHYRDLEHLGKVGELIQGTILSNEHLADLVDRWETFYGSAGVHYIHETGEEIEMEEPDDWDSAIDRSMALMSAVDSEIDRILGDVH